MILPLWGQGCVVTYFGEQTIGEAHRAYTNVDGQYVIDVRSTRWGYDLAFPASAVRLQNFVFDDGEVYSAERAFRARYRPDAINAMLKAGDAPMPGTAVVKGLQVKVNEAGRLEIDNSKPLAKVEAKTASITNPARPMTHPPVRRAVRAPR